MNRDSWLQLAQSQGAIAVIRAPNFQLGLQLAKAVAAGGMRLIEITWDSEAPTALIARLRQDLPHCTIGTGTILSVSNLKNAIAAGAQFVFMPHTNFDLIAIALHREVPIIPGALTPTEIMTAWQAGASSVKVFPVQSVGGASYIQNLHAPLGQIPMIPTGGITLENAKDFIAAGAIAVGLSSSLFPKTAIETENWDKIRHQAETLLRTLQSIGQSSIR
jgi:2-dehydro-3-deoxyphosphogluconate aldolase/(4S)-4-hydroxy-2-oxoglutarate aldolase